MNAASKKSSSSVKVESFVAQMKNYAALSVKRPDTFGSVTSRTQGAKTSEPAIKK